MNTWTSKAMYTPFANLHLKGLMDHSADYNFAYQLNQPNMKSSMNLPGSKSHYISFDLLLNRGAQCPVLLKKLWQRPEEFLKIKMAFQDIVCHISRRGKRRTLNSAIVETPIKISHISQKDPITITVATVMINNRKHRQSTWI